MAQFSSLPFNPITDFDTSAWHPLVHSSELASQDSDLADAISSELNQSALYPISPSLNRCIYIMNQEAWRLDVEGIIGF